MRVTLCDVGPRDGLQNEPETLDPSLRAKFVRSLAVAGLPRIESVSFVNGERVPQMAGAEEVVAAVGAVARWLEELLGRELRGCVSTARAASPPSNSLLQGGFGSSGGAAPT